MNRTEIKRKQALAVTIALAFVNLILFSGITGYNGVTYLSVALYLYLFIDILLNAGSVYTLGRLLKLRYSKGQYRNAEKMKRDVFLSQFICSVVLCAVIMLTAGVITAKLFQMPLSYMIIMLLMPSIVVETLTLTKAGCLKGDGGDHIVIVSGYLRQILICICNLVFCNMLAGYGEKVSGLLGEEAFTSMYGGIGVAISIFVANLITMFFVLFISAVNKRKRRDDVDRMRTTHSFVDNLKVFDENRLFFTVIVLIAFLTWPLSLIFLRKSYIGSADMITDYGVYLAAFCGLFGMLIALIQSVLIPVCGRCLTNLRKDEQRYARNMLQNGVHIGGVHAIFFATFLFVSSHRFASVFFHTQEALAGKMFKSGSFVIFFATLAFYFAEFLIQTGKKIAVLITTIISDICFILLLTVLMNKSDMGIMALVYSALLGFAVEGIVLGVFTFNKIRISFDWMQVIVLPVFVSCLVGLMNYFIDKLFTPHLGQNLTLFICFVLSLSFYWVGLLLLHNFRLQDLEGVPGGKFIAAIGQMLHVI